MKETVLLSEADCQALKRAANLLTRGFSVVEGPTVCGECALALLLTLRSDPSCIAVLRADCHDFFDACIHALCAWPGLFPMKDLQGILTANSRRCVRAQHARTVSDSRSPTRLYNAIGGILYGALCVGRDSPGTRAQVLHKHLCDRKGRWPATPEQLFPLGEQGTIEALLDFADTALCTAPLGMLESLLAVARPIVWPILVSDRYRGRFVSLLAATLDPTSCSPAPASHNDLSVRAAANLLIVIQTGADARQHDIAQLVADPGAPETVYHALSTAVTRFPDGDVQFATFAQWCAYIYALVPRPRPPPPRRALRWLAVHTRQTTRSSMAVALQRLIGQLLHTRACSAPGCGMSPLRTPDGRPFPVCAGCKLTRYCSRACQRRHWNGDGGTDAGPPHRAVCSLLRTFIEQHDPREGAVHVVEVAQIFGPDEMKTLEEWMTAFNDQHGY